MKTFTLHRHFLDNPDELLCDIDFIKRTKKIKVANVASVFDIEASSFYNKDEKQCCMYAWVFGINGKCIRGRTWNEFLNVIDEVVKKYNLNLEKRLIIYVHNLSYEFQWFKKLFNWYKVFAIEPRKPLYAITTNGIEFRCSYLLSGYSLAKLGDNLLKYKVNKLVGDLDYNLIRHSQTPLNDKEWEYILNDGLVVMAYIQEEIERLGNINKIPYTKTGYVRNLCSEKCLKGENRYEYSKLIKRLTMTEPIYKQLKRTYTGGFTHANINYVDTVINNVHSFDFTSSYPAVMLSEKYPMSKAHKHIIKDDEDFINKLKKYCCMFDITFHNIRSKVSFENYISKARCYEADNYVLNNGRIIEADKITMSCTEQDFFIIAEMYEWDKIEIRNFNYFFKDYLPKDFILTILDLYRDKTMLKGVAGKEVEYLVSKGMINSCYGMCVTDPCRDDINYENEWSTSKGDIEKLLNSYNNSPIRTLYYPWGVWITAYARRNLFKGILEFKNDYVYSDTDSIKVVNIKNHLQFIEDYNKKVQQKIKKCLEYHNINYSLALPKTIKNETKPLGIWEYEGKYDRFKTLGAKRYMVEINNKITFTISGVNKINGMKYLYYIYKTNDAIFDAFTEDLCFPAAYDYNGEELNASGKLCHTYIDNFMSDYVIDYLGNKALFNEFSGVHMEPTEYNLSLDAEFKKLLQGIIGGHFIK